MQESTRSRCFSNALPALSRHSAAREAVAETAPAEVQARPTDVPQPPQKAVSVALDPAMSVSDAFSAIARSALEHLRSNEKGMLVSVDPEYVHQMRVAVRRLRSAISVFSSVLPEASREPIAQNLKWLGTALGPARDWDVFASETLPCVQRAYPEHAALAGVSSETVRRRSAARGAARRAIRAPKYQALIADLKTWLEMQAWRENADPTALAALDALVKRYAQFELEKRYARVRRRGRRLEALSAAELHRLRIATKKLRYSMDFFSSLFEPEPVRRLRSRLSRLQDILGTMNDAATLALLVERHFVETRARGAAEARGILLGWAAGRADALAHELERAWRPFRRSETYW